MARRNPYYRGPVSDHFDGVRFFSHPEPARRGIGAGLRFVRGQVARRWRGAPEVVPDRPPPRVEGLRIGPIGHSSLLLQVGGANLLIDPVLAEWLGPRDGMGPRRAHPPGIAWEDLPPVDAVLLTHNHWDHMDGPGVARLWRRFGCRVLAPLGNDAVLRRYDPAMPVEALDWWDGRAVTERIGVHLLPAYHWSGRHLLDRRMALWGSWAVTDARGGVLIHVGDTAYIGGAIFREMRERFGPADVALVPIGAYEPQSFVGTQHVHPEDSVRIMRDLGARRAFGHHWGCFQLTWEGWDDPPRALEAALRAQGVDAERFRPLWPGRAVEAGWPGAGEPQGARAGGAAPAPPG
jgi:L-ascorbate metabolism protein UlaG (beta-lactamase superfamily)